MRGTPAHAWEQEWTRGSWSHCGLRDTSCRVRRMARSHGVHRGGSCRESSWKLLLDLAWSVRQEAPVKGGAAREHALSLLLPPFKWQGLVPGSILHAPRTRIAAEKRPPPEIPAREISLRASKVSFILYPRLLSAPRTATRDAPLACPWPHGIMHYCYRGVRSIFWRTAI